MFIKKKSILFVLPLLFLTACTQRDLTEKPDFADDIAITTAEIQDYDLKSMVEGWSAKYSQMPKNESASTYQNLSKRELQTLVGEEMNLTGLHEISAKKIGEDYFYIVVQEIDDHLQEFTIYKNQESVFAFKSEPQTSFSPIVSVRVIEDKYTVEYLEKLYSRTKNKFLQNQRVWQDGRGEITKTSELTNVIMPFEANGKMVFLGEKEGKWSVYFDGVKSVEEFDSINFGYCCEPALYMPKAFNYRYLTFFASQESAQKLVEVDLGGE